MGSYVNIQRLEAHSNLLIDSFYRATGRTLLEYNPKLQSAAAATALFEANFVLLSHGTEPDPILNYGNKAALRLWEMDWETFTSTPSRLTAEPMERTEREKLLNEVRRQGYSDGYTGIRVSSSGTRFEIRDAVIWSVVDADNQYQGQAAMFREWKRV
ncbi:MEKHLA domain-containing protein [Cohnella silvisoli]|uniref:MEKHLA domain-containing protein n=1 Tax=Cohnella silvisoli TaxID=2873699 RepID=A0ABV1KWV5_9BACL|nr:MEKHLA domain-containing protein [Cohnella silvisoli]MCD9023862.1 MEKHLA domain-containing protein [Cohnella silvisoli]